MGTGLSQKKAPKSAGNTEEKKPIFRDDLFLGTVVGMLRTEGIIDETDHEEQAAFWDALGTWGATLDAPYQEKFESAIEAAVEFGTWLQTSGWTYSEPILYHTTGFTITLTMQAASGEISVAQHCELVENADLSSAIKKAKVELQSAVVAAFPRSANGAKPSSKSSGKSAKSTEVETEEADYDMMRVERRNGRIECRLIPVDGKWVQYGVALYSDVAKKQGFDIPSKPGEYSVSGHMVYEVKEDGRPRRVITIEADDEVEDEAF